MKNQERPCDTISAEASQAEPNSVKAMMDAANYSVSETLRDGTTLLIRAIRPDDKQRLLQHFQGLSQQSVYYRFFGLKRSLGDDDLFRLTELDFVNHVGLAATVDSAECERFIGIGRYIRTEKPSRAEVAFAVLDEYQGHGIGTLLLKHLAKIAQSKGIHEFSANVLGSNHQMLEVFANSGLSVHDSYECGVVHVRLDIGR
jgi:GNAT superfamily N-acetyltransferase